MMKGVEDTLQERAEQAAAAGEMSRAERQAIARDRRGLLRDVRSLPQLEVAVPTWDVLVAERML